MIEPVVFTLEISGLPVGQPRMRHALMRTKGGKSFVRGYNPDTADGWKNRVILAMGQYKPPAPHLGPVRIDRTFYFPRPQRLLKPGSPAGPIPHTAKPDLDNLDKAVFDALKSSHLYRDDAQVYGGNHHKLYVALGAQPGAVLRITLEPEL